MLNFDHVMAAPNYESGERYAAFCYSYIHALIQAVDELG
jgi:hypothetical protein